MMALKRGDNSANVKLWQEFLIGQGFKQVSADGNFGPLTENATRAFQRLSHLREDGIVGMGTYAAAKAKGFGGMPVEAEKPSDLLILVSAGHTNTPGMDRGAAGHGFIEGVEALKLRDAVGEHLREKGCSVLEDGADGKNDTLSKALVLARKADKAVEFHFNAGPSSATGIEVLAKPKHKAFAQRLAKAISLALQLPMRGDHGYKADNSGQHHRLAFCEANGLIVEICFISNKQDMAAFVAHFDRLAVGLANAIAE